MLLLLHVMYLTCRYFTPTIHITFENSTLLLLPLPQRIFFLKKYKKTLKLYLTTPTTATMLNAIFTARHVPRAEHGADLG